jgi:hypothetical protein
MVEEKESKLRELLCIMGLRPWVLQASWIISYAVIFTVVSVLMVVVAGSEFTTRPTWRNHLCCTSAAPGGCAAVHLADMPCL